MDKSETELALKCASEFANFLYGLEEDYEDKLLENRVLKKLGLLNEKGDLVNREGKRVDIDGNLLDDEGARVDKDGNRIDINNNPVIDDDVIETLEFEDDLLEGAVEDNKPEKKTRTSSAKRTTKKKEVVATEESTE